MLDAEPKQIPNLESTNKRMLLVRITLFAFLALGLFIAVASYFNRIAVPEQKSQGKNVPVTELSSDTSSGSAQEPATMVTATEAQEVEFVRTVKVQGTITGGYRDINNIQMLSTGELAYLKSVFPKDQLTMGLDDVQETYFVGDREIPQKDILTPVKEIGGKLAYLVNSASRSRQTLIFGSDKKSPDNYFKKFEDIGGKLAYVYHKPDERLERLVYDDREVATADSHFTLLKDVGGKLAYVKRDGLMNFKETLFYDGQEIETTGTPQDIELIAGKLAYIVHDDAQEKDILFYGGKQVDIADSIGGLADMNGKLMYQMKNSDGASVLVEDGKRIATLGDGYAIRSVGGKLAYTVVTSDPDNERPFKQRLFYDGVQVASASFDAFMGAAAGEAISDIEDVGGKLVYLVENTEGEDALFYDGKKILTAEIIGNSYQPIDLSGEYYIPYTSNGMKPFYFFGADEKDGVTTFSIYRIAPI